MSRCSVAQPFFHAQRDDLLQKIRDWEREKEYEDIEVYVRDTLTPWIDPKGGGESSTPPTFPPARLGLASGTDA